MAKDSELVEFESTAERANGVSVRVVVAVPGAMFDHDIDWSRPGATLDRVSAKNRVLGAVRKAYDEALRQVGADLVAELDRRIPNGVEPGTVRVGVDGSASLGDGAGAYVKPSDTRSGRRVR